MAILDLTVEGLGKIGHRNSSPYSKLDLLYFEFYISV